MRDLDRTLPDPSTDAQTIGDSLVGLVDIGSNSIRLVIYRASGRLPHPVFNEREVCRLGEGVDETGVIAEDRKEHALRALSRFAQIIEASMLKRLDIFATEALRKASNAAAFIAEAETILPAKIRVLSGQEEAFLSGKGVLSGFINIDGVAGDLGGGSLELTHIRSGEMLSDDNVASLALGHLLHLEQHEIAARLIEIDWLDQMKGKPFYAVGGAWRGMATAYTAASKSRIDVVHGLTLAPAVIKKLINDIVVCDGNMKGVPPARRNSMPQAVKVMSVILDHLQPSSVIFSSYGVREGILYDALSGDIRSIDPLMAGVLEYGMMTERFQGLGQALAQQMEAFTHKLPENVRRLARACCYLADISWLDHPDYRASLAIEKMLGLSVVGIDHIDRAWMAAVLSMRYKGTLPSRKVLRGMLSRKERKTARYVGLVLRMLMSASGGIPSLVDCLQIVLEKKSIHVGIPDDLLSIDGGLIDRRIEAIAPYTSLKISSSRI
jgi:exopolyphosphatase/guanosine-5'-triphosphate,3'-diphosphate pyrophosphatase